MGGGEWWGEGAEKEKERDMEVWGGERLRDRERSPGRERPHSACLGERGPEVLQRQLPHHHPTNLRPAPSSLQEGGREQVRPELLDAPWGAPLLRAIPYLPSWDPWVGPCQTYFLVRGCYQKNGRSKGQGKEKRGKSIFRGVTISGTQSPKEVFQILPLALPPGSTQLSTAPPSPSAP